jgi:bifunctional DNA-binding transcriptional regulator/antitoxin component of YhaV-PrlF toxin-antitoxin module
MTVLTITEKGQVTLLKELLRHLGVGPGDKIEVDMLPDGRIEARAAPKKGHISDIFGMFRKENGPRLTIEEMNRIIEEGWAGGR